MSDTVAQFMRLLGHLKCDSNICEKCQSHSANQTKWQTNVFTILSTITWFVILKMATSIGMHGGYYTMFLVIINKQFIWETNDRHKFDGQTTTKKPSISNSETETNQMRWIEREIETAVAFICSAKAFHLFSYSCQVDICWGLLNRSSSANESDYDMRTHTKKKKKKKKKDRIEWFINKSIVWGRGCAHTRAIALPRICEWFWIRCSIAIRHV